MIVKNLREHQEGKETYCDAFSVTYDVFTAFVFAELVCPSSIQHTQGN